MVKGNFIQELKMAGDLTLDQNGALGPKRFSYLGSSKRGSFLRAKSSDSSILTSIKSEHLMDEINEEDEHRWEVKLEKNKQTIKETPKEINVLSLDENRFHNEKEIKESKFKKAFNDIRNKYFSPISISPKQSNKLASLMNNTILNTDTRQNILKATFKTKDDHSMSIESSNSRSYLYR